MSVQFDDSSTYSLLSVDPTESIIYRLKQWISQHLPKTTVTETDISAWLIPDNTQPGKIRVMLKTHKEGTPLRLIFSSCGTPTRNLSQFLHTSYLKPIVDSGVLRWRIKDTTEFLRHVSKCNKFLWTYNITQKPQMKAVDIENCFPSITKRRALPAISRRLKQRKFKVPEIKAVTEGLKICRECTTFQTNGKIYSQTKGCGLGPPDSCSYCDIAIDDVLQEIVPQIEAKLNLTMDWLCFFRDDGWVLIFDQRDLTEEILNIFNTADEDLVFTSPQQLD